MKTLTVRLPERLVAEIEAESRGRGCTKSDIVRERLERGKRPTQHKPGPLDDIADLIGCLDIGPPDLSSRKKYYLRARINAKKRRS
jgi:hypothetical protein